MILETGYRVTITKTFSQADFDEFAGLSGDDNPIHVDPHFSARTKFGRTAAHGMLLYGTICGVLSQQFPGAKQLEQRLMFPAPTFADEAMTITVEVVELMNETEALLKTTFADSQGKLTCDGETVLSWSTE